MDGLIGRDAAPARRGRAMNQMLSVRSEPFDRLRGAIDDRTAVIGVVGLGYVGLPLSLTATDAGFRVLGFDIDPDRVEAVNAAEPVIKHLDVKALGDALRDRRFAATNAFDRLAEADILAICVPTPLRNGRDPDLSYVEATARSIARRIRPGQLVVLESTTWPGTTREIVAPILEAAGAKIGVTNFLAFSPEREDPGNAHFDTRTTPKVVGADDERSQALASAFYGAVVDKVVPVKGTATAEAVKLTENIFRAVNIGLVNELKAVYGAMGVDVWDVIDAAATKPFGFMPFYPGPGLGGHCIPIDPFYLTWKAREFGVETRFIELAGEINDAMPSVVVDRLAESLAADGVALEGARILLMGVAYKKNIDDIRESPSLVLIEELEARKAVVDFHDPLVPQIPPTREHARLGGRRSAALTADAVAGYDAVLISTDHDAVDYALIAGSARRVVDTRNVFGRLGLSNPALVKA